MIVIHAQLFQYIPIMGMHRSEFWDAKFSEFIPRMVSIPTPIGMTKIGIVILFNEEQYLVLETFSDWLRAPETSVSVR